MPAVTRTMSSAQAPPNLVDGIAALAAHVAESEARVLTGEEMAARYVREVECKVAALSRKELAPLLVGVAEKRLVTAVKLAGEFLGLGYLGDYALENGIPFSLSRAADQVREICRIAGLEYGFTEEMLFRLCRFYESEAIVETTGSARSKLQRYILKSSDVLLAQAVALSAAGLCLDEASVRCLGAAAAALDVVDDWEDRDEDLQHQARNPFAALQSLDGSAERCTYLFRQLAAPYCADLIGGLASYRLCHSLRAYCAGVLSRVRATGLELSGQACLIRS